MNRSQQNEQQAASASLKRSMTEREGAFTQRNMNRSQQSWVKTFMQDVMDEKGQSLFDNLTWFAKKLCSVMTSVSVCEHMWNIEGWIHNHPSTLRVEGWMGLADTHQ